MKDQEGEEEEGASAYPETSGTSFNKIGKCQDKKRKLCKMEHQDPDVPNKTSKQGKNNLPSSSLGARALEPMEVTQLVDEGANISEDAT